MRERVVVASVGIAVLVLLMFGVFRAYSVGQLVEAEEQSKIERSATLIADLVRQRESADQPVTSAYLNGLLSAGERIRYVAPGGATRVTGVVLDTADPATIQAREPIDAQRDVTLWRSGDLVDQRVADQLLPLAILAVVMVLVAGLLGYLAAARLSRPFRELAGFARALGRGRFDLDIPRYRIPEAQQIGTAMHDSGHRLGEMVAREREFAANASHQLRTPITALRLELEDLSLWPEVTEPMREQLARAVGEVDRLGTTVTDLLDLARGRRLSGLTDVDLGELAGQAVDRWRGRVESQDRALEYVGHEAVAIRLAPGPVGQILDVLLSNALDHGAGTVRVEVARPDHYARVTVADEGRRDFGSDIFTRRARHPDDPDGGIGLAVATEVADAIGGHLVLEPEERTRFTLMLPLAPCETA